MDKESLEKRLSEIITPFLIYELRYDNDEFYETIGFFSSLEKAKEQLKPENIQKILNILPHHEEDIDIEKFEIYEQTLDVVKDCNWKEIYFAHFSSAYNEEKDEYIYELLMKQKKFRKE